MTAQEAVGLFHSMILFCIKYWRQYRASSLFGQNHSFEQGTRMGRVGCVRSSAPVTHDILGGHWDDPSPPSPWKREWVSSLTRWEGQPWLPEVALPKFVPFSVASVLFSLLLGWDVCSPDTLSSTITSPRSPFLTHSHIFFCSLTMKLEESSLMEGNPAHSCPCKGTGPSGTWGRQENPT